jgi:DNA polymerase-3 subunit delta'
LRTPSIEAITKLLIDRDGIEPNTAKFAASAAQGHVGRAKYLATSNEARETREKILNLPSTITDLASAFEAANTLLEMAKEQALSESEMRNEIELSKLKESYGTTGSRLATGGSKAVKELEKEQKLRGSRLLKDFLDRALLEIITVFSSSISNRNSEDYYERDVEHLNHYLKCYTATLEAQKSIKLNYSPNLMLEKMFVSFLQIS